MQEEILISEDQRVRLILDLWKKSPLVVAQVMMIAKVKQVRSKTPTRRAQLGKLTATRAEVS